MPLFSPIILVSLTRSSHFRPSDSLCVSCHSPSPDTWLVHLLPLLSGDGQTGSFPRIGLFKLICVNILRCIQNVASVSPWHSVIVHACSKAGAVFTEMFSFQLRCRLCKLNSQSYIHVLPEKVVPVQVISLFVHLSHWVSSSLLKTHSIFMYVYISSPSSVPCQIVSCFPY